MTPLSVDSRSVVFLAALTGTDPERIVKDAQMNRAAGNFRAVVVAFTWLAIAVIVVCALYALLLLVLAAFYPEPVNLQLPTI